MTLGACLLANDIPYEGLAKEIIQARVDGKSWKTIADEFDLGSPGKARSTFTKLTGLTDYKVTGGDMLKLVKGSVPDGMPDVPIVKPSQAPGSPDLGLKAVDPLDPKAKPFGVSTHLPKSLQDEWYDQLYQSTFDLPSSQKLAARQALYKRHKNNTMNFKFIDDWMAKYDVPKPFEYDAKKKALINTKKSQKKSYFNKTEVPNVTKTNVPDSYWKPDAPDVSGVPQRQAIVKMLESNDPTDKYYWKIKQQTFANTPDIDKVVYDFNLKKTNGNAWEAYKLKDNSVEGYQGVVKLVQKAKKDGFSIDEIVSKTGIPKATVNKIIDGTWQPSGFPSSFFAKKPASGVVGGGPELPDVKTGVKGKVPDSTDMGSVKPGVGTGSGQVDQKMFPFATNQKLDNQRGRVWANQGFSTKKTEAERAITRYTGSAYHEINSQLRGTAGSSTKAINSTVRKMDGGMYEVDEAFSVTRGMDRRGFGLGHITDNQIESLVGKVVSDDGFLSTSTKPVFQREVRLNIEVPVGAKGHWAKPISQHSHEDEFILARGTKLMILGMEKSTGYGGGWIVRARVVV